MATTPISVEEYLYTAYEPDAEYVDGVIEERPMGDDGHGVRQVVLAAFPTGIAANRASACAPSCGRRSPSAATASADTAVIDAALPKEPVALTPS